MALQVWLPLNGDTHNQGLSDITITNNGATIDNNGKIGKCYSFDGIDDYLTLTNINCNAWAQCSIAFWCYPTNNFNYFFLIRGNGAHRFKINDEKLVFRDTNHSNQVVVPFNATVDINKWNHIVCTYNRGEVFIYINGILTNHSVTYYNSTSVLLSDLNEYRIARIQSTNADGYYTGKINDFRIYDHALSPKEVEEISKGLILHYKLDNNGMGNPNLMLGTKMSETPSSTGNPMIYYNTNASNCIAHDNQVTITLNSTANLGIAFIRSASEINLNSNEYYTLSCEAKTSRNGAQLSIGTSYYNTNGNGVWRGGTNKQSFSSLNRWERFSLTFKPDADTDRISYCFTATGASGGTDTLEIRHCKLEKGNIATLWAPAPEEMESINLVYDSSGYNNNGEIINTLSTTTDSPKYSICTHISATNQKIHISDFLTSGFGNSYTFAWWGKRNDNGPMFWGFSDGIRLNGMYAGRLWNTGDGSNNPLYKIGTTTQVTAPSTGVWHHYTMTGDGTKCYVYLDGEQWGEAKTYKAISGTSIYINGWNNSTSYCSDNTDISDFRIYATTLNPSQIKELYNTSMVVDSNGNIKPREVAEL